MRIAFAGSRHPVFRGTSPLSRGMLKTKGGGKTSIHYNMEPQTAELLLRTKIAVNQLSILGAVADLVPRFCSASRRSRFRSTGRLVANVSDDEAPKVPSELVSRLTKNSIWNSEAR